MYVYGVANPRIEDGKEQNRTQNNQQLVSPNLP